MVAVSAESRLRSLCFGAVVAGWEVVCLIRPV